MAKPTLLQSILNQPTRTYLDPSHRIAPPPSLHYRQSISSYKSASSSSEARNKRRSRYSTDSVLLPKLSPENQLLLSPENVVVIADLVEQSPRALLPVPPSTSSKTKTPRSVKSATTRTHCSSSSPTDVAVDGDKSIRVEPLRHPNPPRCQKSDHQPTSCNSLPTPPHHDAEKYSDEEQDEEIFYTPSSSPPGSPERTPAWTAATTLDDPQSTLPEMSIIKTMSLSVNSIPTSSIPNSLPSLPQLHPKRTANLKPPAPPITAYMSTTSVTSTSTAPPSEAAFSDFSWRPPSVRSDTTVASSSKSSKSNLPRGVSRRSQSSHGSLDELTSEWAKGVRWLVPPEELAKRAQSRTSLSRSHSTKSAESVSSRRTASSGDKSLSVYSDGSEGPVSPQEYLARSNMSHQPRRRPRSRQAESSSAADRMSAVLEVDENNEVDGAHRIIGTTRPSQPRIPGSQRPRSFSAPSARSRRSHHSTTSSHSSQTVVIPSPLPVSDGSTSHISGYSNLTLPRAAYTPQPAKFSEKVDLTLSGLAQTTMSSISVTRHAAEIVPTTRNRRLSLSFFSGGIKSRTDSPTPARLLGDEPSPLSFTSSTPPPSKVHAGQVLVHVWVVGLDGLDRLLVHEKVQKPEGFGFVPGRSFVGRAIECGWEVTNINKGDWVFGLLDLTKCGALSEFVLVDRKRICLAPAPSAQLSLEQIALLPLLGTPARRAVKTISAFPQGLSALVLNAHAGAGSMVTQELVALGVKVTGQVPPTIPGATDWAKRSGAADVVTGEPLGAIEGLPESAFDVVIDTVGGKAIWDASRRILRPAGSQFTTLVGDSENTVPTINALAKSNMRSLRRAFAKKDRKNIGYEWVSPASDIDNEGEDIRDALAAISATISEEGRSLTPVSANTLPFERTPEAFNSLEVGAVPPVSSFELTVIRVVG